MATETYQSRVDASVGELKRAYAHFAALKLQQPVTAKKDVDFDSIDRLLWEHGLQHVLSVLEMTRSGSGGGTGAACGSRGVSLRNPHIVMKQLLSCVSSLTSNNSQRNLQTMHAALINKYLTGVMTTMRSISDNHVLLVELSECWARHRLVTEVLRLLFSSVDYVAAFKVDEKSLFGLTACVSLTASSHRLFRTAVMEFANESLLSSIRELVTKDRDGVVTDRAIIKKAVDMYRVLGVVELPAMANLKDDNDVTERVVGSAEGDTPEYIAMFREPFIRASEEYFRRHARAWLAEAPINVFIRKVQDALVAEDERSRAILPPTSHVASFDAIRSVLLRENTAAILSSNAGTTAQLLSLLRDASSIARDDVRRDSRLNDLARTYTLLVGMPEHTGEPLADAQADMVTAFQKAVAEVGCALVRTLDAGQPQGGESKDEEKGPPKVNVNNPEFVEHLYALLFVVQQVHQVVFQTSTQAMTALINGMSTVLNSHAAHPEILATYTDAALHGKRGKDSIGEAQIDEAVVLIVELLPYLSAKDCFREFYTQHLAKRLLLARSASLDAEKASISRLKKLCGPAYTAKLEGMVTDLGVGQGIEQMYKDACSLRATASAREEAVDFGTTVLKAGMWPHFIMCSSLTLPPAMKACATHFAAFFEHENASKMLAWVWSQGSATLDVAFTAAKIKLVTTTMQAVVLLHLQQGRCSVGKLATITGIDVGLLKHVVGSLATVKGLAVVAKKPAGPRVQEADEVEIDWAFKSPKRQITLPAPKLVETNQRMDAAITEERKMSLDACIVRTMKARTTLQHARLVEEIIKQIRFFRPEPRLIKQRIEDLIGRRYLRREDPMNPASPYIYVAGDGEE